MTSSTAEYVDGLALLSIASEAICGKLTVSSSVASTTVPSGSVPVALAVFLTWPALIFAWVSAYSA